MTHAHPSQKDRRTRLRVDGPVRLSGTVPISGAKNAALAMMCAALLTDEDVVLTNVPRLTDVDSLAHLLRSLGARVELVSQASDLGPRTSDLSLRINASDVSSFEAPADLINENRASFQVTGPLLTRFGEASAPPPGGDSIGQRPIDVHLRGFAQLGASVERVGDRHVARARDGLHGARIFMDYPSVSGTQNVMMAAVRARGHTTIVNAATEPEVSELACLLNTMGANIKGVGSQWLEIDGVEQLGGAQWSVMPDRIEAGTFAIATAMTGGDALLEDAPVQVMDALIGKLRDAGAEVEAATDGLHVSSPGELKAFNFQALPYPGLPTDLQAPLVALLTQARGTAVVHERVFDNRLLYIPELAKLGADITGGGSVAYVHGPSTLHGGHVRALDIRAGVAVLLCALVAQGTTVVEDIHHLDRGYDRLEEKLRGLGATVERID
jgi:UDP-N-acetylglucosamine 1-carboxyvinyltransferase